MRLEIGDWREEENWVTMRRVKGVEYLDCCIVDVNDKDQT